jgi:hypothetical protein
MPVGFYSGGGESDSKILKYALYHKRRGIIEFHCTGTVFRALRSTAFYSNVCVARRPENRVPLPCVVKRTVNSTAK